MEAVVPEAVTTRPRIIEEEGRHQVWVEGVLVAEAGELVTALVVWAVAHFVYHQKTARPIKNTNWFMRTYVLGGLPVEIPPLQGVEKAIEELCD